MVGCTACIIPLVAQVVAGMGFSVSKIHKYVFNYGRALREGHPHRNFSILCILFILIVCFNRIPQ
jgi:hypothetical protein